MRHRLLFPLLSLLLIFGGVLAAHADATPTVGMMQDCFLQQVAFCDNFSEGPYTGTATNRGGALDPAKWSFARETERENPSGLYDAFSPTQEQFCQTPISGVLPDNDSFMCSGTNGVTTQNQGTEDMHWMTAMNDGGNYATIGARALQPFDFAGRTGTIAFMVDAVTQGPHSTWPSLVLSDQPINMPHKINPGVQSPPRNGFQIDWNAGCGTQAAPTDFYPGTKVGGVTVFNNTQENDLSIPYQGDSAACVTAANDKPNLVLVQVTTTSLDVWMADYIQNMQPGVAMTPPMPKHILHLDQGNGFALNMTRGYLSFEQAQYAACKFNTTCQQTYHWHAIGFDGPVLPADRDYQIADSLTPLADGSVAVGYYLQGQTVVVCCQNGGNSPAAPFRFGGVDLSGADAAYLTFNWRDDSAVAPNLQVRLNGNPWRPVTVPNNGNNNGTTNALAAIPVSDLMAGTNSLQFTSQAPGTLTNIDLVVQASAAVTSSTSAATPTETPTTTPTATPTAVPTATPTTTPTATPTTTPTATPTTAPTDTPTATPTTSPSATAVSTATTTHSSATSTPSTATWSTTLQVPAQYGGHNIPAVCTANTADWHTLDCKASF